MAKDLSRYKLHKVVDWFERGRFFEQTGPHSGGGGVDIITIYNNTGVDINALASLLITGVIDESLSDDELMERYLNYGVEVTCAARPVGRTDVEFMSVMTLNFLKNGGVGRGLFDGAFCAPVHFVSTKDKYAAGNWSDARYPRATLVSGYGNQFRIVAKPSNVRDGETRFAVLGPSLGSGHLVGTVKEKTTDDTDNSVSYTVRVDTRDYPAVAALDNMDYNIGDQVIIHINHNSDQWEIIAPSGEGGHLIGVIKSKSSGVYKVQVGVDNYDANSPLASDLDTGLKCAISKNRRTGEWDIIAVECPEE